MLIGAPLSGNIAQLFYEAELLNADVMQIDITKVISSPRLGLISEAKFRQNLMRFHLNVVAHGSRFVNLAEPEGVGREKSLDLVREEIVCCERLGLSKLIYHLGYHRGAGETTGLEKLVEALDTVTDEHQNVDILLETGAGKDDSLGWRFEQIGYIIDNCKNSEHLGVCFDVSHVFSAGYDFSNRKKYSQVFKEFSKVIDINKIGGFHLSNPKKKRGSRTEHHGTIKGGGYISMDSFVFFLTDSTFCKTPAVLETEGDGRNPIDFYKEEIAFVRKMGMLTDVNT